MYQHNPGTELDQGDILRSVPVIHKGPRTSEEAVEIIPNRVFVFTNGCEIDKPDTPAVRADVVHVACVNRLDLLTGGLAGHVRRGRVLYYCPLLQMPGKDGPIDAFIDWRTLQPLDKISLLTARAGEQYHCSVGRDIMKAVASHFWDFWFRDTPYHTVLAERADAV